MRNVVGETAKSSEDIVSARNHRSDNTRIEGRSFLGIYPRCASILIIVPRSQSLVFWVYLRCPAYS